MPFVTRRLLTAGLAAAGLLLATGPGAAAEYPTKAIRIIVGFGAGDAIDGTARVLADRMSERLDVPVPVVNMPGGGGARGLAAAAKAEADGHTLVMGSTGALTARPLFSDAGYTPDSFAPIAQLTEVPIGLAVPADSAFDSIGDIVEAAKADPGAVRYSTPAAGSTQHINMEAFADRHGIELTHIGGKGGKGAMTKAMSGEVDFVFVGASNYTGLAESGDLEVLGVASEEPVDYLPDAPTFQQAGYDLVAAVWFGLLAPAGTPDAALETLRGAVGEIARTDATLDLYDKYNFNPAYLDHQGFAERIQANVERHREVLRAIGLLGS